MPNLDNLKSMLVMLKNSTNDKVTLLKLHLLAHNVTKLHAILMWLSVKLYGAVRMANNVERCLCIAQLGCVHGEKVEDDDLLGLHYVTKEVKEKLCVLTLLFICG